MKQFLSPYSSPTLNLAIEEHLFELSDEDFMLIYINSDSVVVGKHQNAIAESNSRFLHESGIPLVRRFSGGGTVFHDRGNINFSFITTAPEGHVIDFRKYGEPVVAFIRSLGVRAILTERFDITVDNLKISGHAAHAKRLRSLHHGTILYNADLQRLSLSLRSSPGKFRSRAVNSVRSSVVNLSDYVKGKLDVNEFVELFSDSLAKHFSIDGQHELTAEYLAKCEKLAVEKYGQYAWNYGYSSDYEFDVNLGKASGNQSFNIRVSEGRIASTGEGKILEKLVGCRHYWPDVAEKMSLIFGQEQSEILAAAFF